ncbi:MAG: 4Fe-4S dicluster domain-containing protein [Planctomycetes bacterium]|nr:4Fe-4S dicluster domain-containing protein [Planctomycetota bacterium]
MAQLGWTIDLTRCVGCHACSVACKSENNTAPLLPPVSVRNGKAVAVNYRRVLNSESGTYPSPVRTFVTMACHHCFEPACLKACPVDAISKRSSDGIVLIDYDECIGCKYCLWACPYGAPQFNETTGKVEKCTFCVHRIDAGLAPACVTTCTGKALNYESDFDEDLSGAAAPDGFASASYTLPAVRFST